MSIFYFFIDGIGIGPRNNETNPFSRYSNSVLSICSANTKPDSISKSFLTLPLDASMGVSGLPQSATGQTSLWTGQNGPRIQGHHLTGFPGPTLRSVIKEYSIIKRFYDKGYQTTLLNAYSEKFLKKLEKVPRLASASTHTQWASGQSLLTLTDLEQGKAMFMDITHLIMHQYYPEYVERFPIVDAKQRGIYAIKIAHNYELVLFEYFISDKAGHSQDFDTAKYVIETLEQFITGMYEALDEKDTLIISSDHGNLEDLSIKTHTMNSVPLLVAGHLQKEFKKNMTYLYDIPRRIYDIYGFEPLTEPIKTD